MNFFSTLSRKQKIDLAQTLNTKMNYFRHYVSGHKTPGTNRIVKIIDWATKNTPKNVPTLQELANNKEHIQ